LSTSHVKDWTCLPSKDPSFPTFPSSDPTSNLVPKVLLLSFLDLHSYWMIARVHFCTACSIPIFHIIVHLNVHAIFYDFANWWCAPHV
jgi:hypothetical protein